MLLCSSISAEFVLLQLLESFLSESLPHSLDNRVSDQFLLLSELNYLPTKSKYRVIRLQDLEHVTNICTLHDLLLQNLHES